MPAARLVALPPTDHDRRRIVAGGPAVDQPLIPARGSAADHADRMQLIHQIGNGHELRHGSEWLAAKVRVRSREYHAGSARSHGSDERDDPGIEKLRLVDGNDLRVVAKVL